MRLHIELDPAREEDFRGICNFIEWYINANPETNRKLSKLFGPSPPLPPPATTCTGCPPVDTNTLSPKGPSPTPPTDHTNHIGYCRLCGGKCGPGYDVCYGCHMEQQDGR